MKPIDRILQQEANVYLRTELGLEGVLLEDLGDFRIHYYTYFSEVGVHHEILGRRGMYDRRTRISIGDSDLWFGGMTLLNYIQQARQKMRAWAGEKA